MKKKCFIITPIGNEGSEIRKIADNFIEHVIKPALEAFEYEPIPAHKISKSGSIIQQIIDHLIHDDLVIANLTGPNPNVMYELAVRHATMKPVVCVVENTTELPFDITTERVIPYEESIAGGAKIKEDLKLAIEEIKDEKESDNPISRALQFEKALIQSQNIQEMAKSIKGEQGDALKLILEKLTLIEQTNKLYFKDLTKDRIFSYEIPIDIEIGKLNATKYITINEGDSVQRILDKIYFLIDNEVSPREYMKTWVLKEKTKDIYLIIYEITDSIPANLVFLPNLTWKVVKWEDDILDTIHEHRRKRL